MSVFVKKSLLAVAFVMAAGHAVAQESTNQVGSNTDWYVYEESQPNKTCW